MSLQFLAILKHELSGITLDMIAKKILDGILQPNVQAIVTTDTKSMTEKAEAADSFLSSSGQLLKQAFPRSVCLATPPTVSPQA